MFEHIVKTQALHAARELLQQEGVVRGSIVAWLGRNSRELLATLAACEQVGAVLMPLDRHVPEDELGVVVTQSGATHLLGTSDASKLAAKLLQVVQPKGGAAEGVQAGDLLLTFGSGHRGDPRAVMHTIGSITASVAAAVDAQGLTASARVLSVLPMFHHAGLCVQTLSALTIGAQVKLHPYFDADRWFDEVEHWRPNTSMLVPPMMRALVAHERWARADLSSLAYVTCGTQLVPKRLVEALHARGVPVAQVYGSTESGSVSIVLRPAEAKDHVGLAGRAALGVQALLTGDGEILVKGPNLMRGYHRSAESGLDSRGWYHTGDLARRHENGMFELLGRSRDLIVSGDEKIHAAEIEAIAVERPEVADCAAVAMADAERGQVPVLAVTLRAGQALDASGLQAALDAHLARSRQPARVVVLADLPRTALGDIKRRCVADLVTAVPA